MAEGGHFVEKLVELAVVETSPSSVRAHRKFSISTAAPVFYLSNWKMIAMYVMQMFEAFSKRTTRRSWPGLQSPCKN